MTAPRSQMRAGPRRGLSRDEAAMYCGVSVGTFNDLLSQGKMPGPWRIGARKVWDIRAIDLALDSLAREDASGKSSWEDAG